MINNASKFALGLALAGVVAAVTATDDKAAALLFVGLFLVGGAVAFGLGRAVGPDVAPFVGGDSPTAATSLDPADVPRASYGPIITGIAVTTLACGGALGPYYVLAAIVIGAIGAAIWLFDTFSQPGVVDARDAHNVEQRLLGPIALPVGAAVLAITLAYSFSRVLLAVSETASWVLAFIVAAVLLLILTMIANRRPSTRAVVSAAAVGLAAVLVAGGVGAGEGERTFEKHADSTPIVDITAANTAFDRNVIGLPADTDVELVFANLDVGTFHNVAVYTDADPGTPIFNGKPIAEGTSIYKFKTPAEGTYRYICDFHPTAMKGELRLTPHAATTSEARGSY
jgi:plastocyanin